LGSYFLEGVIWFLFERITLAWDVNRPHWDGGSSRWLWFFIKMLSVLSDKENDLKQRQIQNGGRDVKLLLFLVNS
jgi:hypothetical protein